jgi:hypothetical protein
MASPKAMRSALHSLLPVGRGRVQLRRHHFGRSSSLFRVRRRYELLGRTFHGSVTENSHRRRSRGCLLAREAAVFR